MTVPTLNQSNVWSVGLGGIKPVVTGNDGIRANLDGGPCTGHGSMLYVVVDCCQ